jgi:fatty-acyl-CoA synthase
MVNDWLVKRSQFCPEQVALIDADSGERVTYFELNQRVTALAAYLRSADLAKGDRVAILDYNNLFYLTLLFALPRLGATLLPLNYRLSPAELQVILDDASPALLFYGSDWMDTVEALKECGVTTATVPADGVELLSTGSDLSAHDDGGLNVSWEDPWLLLYTGGTTGRSKGAVLSYRMVTWNAINTTISWGLTPDDVAVMAMPFFHTGGLNVFTLPLLHLGGTIVVMKSFDPDRYLELIEQEKGTIMFMVPTMYQLMAATAAFAGADLASVRICISGGSPCPEKLYHLYWQRGLPFKQGYGLTECGPNCFALADSDARKKIGSVGKPVFYSRAKIVGDDRREAARGEIGELALAGPHLFSGYWRSAGATAAVLKDGWLYTGDMARCDQDGFYYIVDRKKDMFISGGENIYPFEIEAVLLKHPAVAEAAVVGIPHEKWGEVGRAYLVLKAGHQEEAAGLLDFCRARLARYKIPREIVFKDSLPKSSAGKILKRELE